MFTRSICCVGTNSSATWFGFRGAGAFRLMLSSASLLFTLKSGCLNSHAYVCDQQWPTEFQISCHTPGPYGDVPPSSLLCRTLWKSYLFSCRTKLAKLLCLKCFGRMCFVNFSFCRAVRSALSLRSCKYVPLIRRSYPLRFPIAPRFHLVHSPTFCENGLIPTKDLSPRNNHLLV